MQEIPYAGLICARSSAAYSRGLGLGLAEVLLV